MKSSLLSLAGAALVVTSATACGSTSTAPAADKSSEPAESASVAPATPSPSAATTDAADSASSSGAADDAGSDDGQKAASPCRTNDLRFKVTEESQAGGYYLITATAKQGVTCTLKGVTAPVAFGSAEEAHAGPAEQAAGPTVEVSGDKKAYAGVNPKSGTADGGVQYPQIIISATNEDPNPVSLDLAEDAVVDAPVATNWVAAAGDAVPL